MLHSMSHQPSAWCLPSTTRTSPSSVLGTPCTLPSHSTSFYWTLPLLHLYAEVVHEQAEIAHAIEPPPCTWSCRCHSVSTRCWIDIYVVRTHQQQDPLSPIAVYRSCSMKQFVKPRDTTVASSLMLEVHLNSDFISITLIKQNPTSYFSWHAKRPPQQSTIICHLQFLLTCKVSTSAVHYHLQLKFTSTRMISTLARHIIRYANKSIHILYHVPVLPTPYIYIS
jgi:hypothetical protein